MLYGHCDSVRKVPPVVRATEHESHSQVWSRRSMRTRTTNRFDDLEHMRRRQSKPLVRITVRSGAVAAIASV